MSIFTDWMLGPIVQHLNRLERLIMTSQAQTALALAGIAASLATVGEQLTKATAEIVGAVSNANVTDPAVDAAVVKLQAVADSLRNAAQVLDDLNPDAPVDTPPTDVTPAP